MTKGSSVKSTTISLSLPSSSFWRFPIPGKKNRSRKNSTESVEDDSYIVSSTLEVHENINLNSSTSPNHFRIPSTITAFSTQKGSPNNQLFLEELHNLDMNCFSQIEPLSPIALTTPLLESREILSVLPQKSHLPSRQSRRIAPLSSLPTPPDMGKPDNAIDISISNALVMHMKDPELVGRARYLTDYIPRKVSQDLPRTWLVLSVLVRADFLMEIEVIALAGCILDSLSSGFASKWRHTMYEATEKYERSELLAITALMIAVKFLNDRAPSNSFWAEEILDERFSLLAFNTTERIMLQDIDYSVNYLSTPRLIASSVRRIRTIITEERDFQRSTMSPISIDEKKAYDAYFSPTASCFSDYDESEYDNEENPYYDYNTSDDEDNASSVSSSDDEQHLSTPPDFHLANNKLATPDFDCMTMAADRQAKNQIYPVSSGIHSQLLSFPDLHISVSH